MAFLTRDQILAADDIPTEVIDVPEWGGQVKLKGLTGAERDRFEQDSVQGKGKDTRMNILNIRARLVALCIVDESGKRMFNKHDIEALGKKSAQALDRVFTAAQKLSGLSDEDVEGLADDFDSTQGDNSTSD